MFNEGMRSMDGARYIEVAPKKKFMSMKAAAWVVGTSTLVGAGLGVTHEIKPMAVEEVTDGGRGTVVELDVTLSQQHVIGFKTEVDGAFAQDTQKFPAGAFGIVPEDYISSMTIDDLMILSSLCMDSVDKKVKYFEDEKKYEVRLNMDDVYVCSRKDPNSKPIETPGGNANKHMDGATNEIVRAVKERFGIDLNDPEKIEEQNKLNSALSMTAENAGLRLVNQKCAPQVFDITKQEIKELIAKDVTKRKDETVEVIFEPNADGEVKISGKSDVDQFFAEKEKDERLTYRVDSIGECELAEGLK